MLAFISGLAAVVAVAITYFQWRTAQTKVALGIYATRYAIYQDLRKAVSDFLRDLNFSLEVQGKYMDAQSRARFHFGAEVEQYLESLRRDIRLIVMGICSHRRAMRTNWLRAWTE